MFCPILHEKHSFLAGSGQSVSLSKLHTTWGNIMKKRAILSVGAACAVLATAAFAGGWDHSFSRGFDVYLMGSDQSGIRLVCDSDTLVRKGSYLEIRSAIFGDKVPNNARIEVGAFSQPFSSQSEYALFFKKLTPKDHAALVAAFAVAQTAKIMRGDFVIAEILLGASRPKICE